MKDPAGFVMWLAMTGMASLTVFSLLYRWGGGSDDGGGPPWEPPQEPPPPDPERVPLDVDERLWDSQLEDVCDAA